MKPYEYFPGARLNEKDVRDALRGRAAPLQLARGTGTQKLAFGAVELDDLFFQEPDRAMAVAREASSTIEAVANQDRLAAVINVLDALRFKDVANVLAYQLKQLCVVHVEAGGGAGREVRGLDLPSTGSDRYFRDR